MISEEYDESDMLMHYDELSIQANKLLFLRAGRSRYDRYAE